MPITSKDVYSKLKLYPFDAENVKLLKRPQVDSNGFSTTELIFEIPIELRPVTKGLNVDYYVPGWRERSVADIEKFISSRNSVNNAFLKAERRVKVRRTNKVRYFQTLTKNFTEEVTRMEGALFTIYGYVLSKDEALIQKANLDEINEAIAKELKEYIQTELILHDLGNSFLLRDMNITPMLTSEIRQLKGSKSKFSIRTGVRLHMWAYGFIRDMGRGPTKKGKTIPYGAIAAWCRRYQITPRDGMSFDQMVYAIINKINTHGYKPNWYLHNAVRDFAQSGLTEYLFWKPLTGNMEKRIKKMSMKTGAKYKGWKKSIGNFTLTTGSR